MTNCKSCGVPLIEEDQLRTLSDGTSYIDDFCSDCVEVYIDNVDSLDWKEYAHENLTNVNNKNDDY